MFNPIEVFERVRRPATASVNYGEDKARFVSGRFASAVASGAARWNQLSRGTRFVVAACVVFALTMILLAAWLSSSVESALVQTSITRGVAAIDQSGELLRGDIETARWKISLIFGLITLVMIALISAVGVWANAMLKSQRQRLELQAVALATLVQRTGELEEDLIAARTVAGQISERLLRRVGADLHDGPAQLMGLALLFFDGLKPLETSKQDAAGFECIDTKSGELFETVRRLIRDALGELRNISRDIAPPELAALSTCEVVMLAVSNHQRRTGIVVGRDFEVLPAELSPARKTCVYRFVQEGLSNSYRHAKGAKVFVATRICGSVLSIEVADQGPGFDPTSPRCVSKLGIAGLKDRIACNGGTLELISSVGGGTRLMAHFTLLGETEQPTI